jgi:hypothetical protein
MYKVSKTGIGIKICLSTACINGNGYAKSPGYPISKSLIHEEETGTGTDLSARILVAEWYPKDTGNGIEYIFECKGTGGSGDYLYDYDFGNGYKTFLTTWNRQYQKYPYGDQEYLVTCTVNDRVQKTSKSASMTISP